MGEFIHRPIIEEAAIVTSFTHGQREVGCVRGGAQDTPTRALFACWRKRLKPNWSFRSSWMRWRARPISLQASGKPVSPSSSTNPDQPEEKVQVVSQRSPRPARSIAQQQGSLLQAPRRADSPWPDTENLSGDGHWRCEEQWRAAGPEIEADTHRHSWRQVRKLWFHLLQSSVKGFKTRSPFPEFLPGLQQIPLQIGLSAQGRQHGEWHKWSQS